MSSARRNRRRRRRAFILNVFMASLRRIECESCVKSDSHARWIPHRPSWPTTVPILLSSEGEKRILSESRVIRPGNLAFGPGTSRS